MTFICTWGTFAYKKIPFGLKNVEITFQHAMNFSLHDIKHIFKPYLDELPTDSRKRKISPRSFFGWYIKAVDTIIFV